MAVLDGFDDVDRALVHALQIDGRASFGRIAQAIGVSDQTVARRFSKLQRTNALRVLGISTQDSARTPQWVLRVRASPGAAAEVAAALARRTDTSWIDLCSGGTEIVGSADGVEAALLLLDALPRTRQVLDVRAEQVMHVFYGGVQQAFTKEGPLSSTQVDVLTAARPRPSHQRAARLDHLDQRLLTLLRDDGRLSVERLAAAADTSASTVRRRLQALVVSGVLHFAVDVDLGLLQLPVRTLLWLEVDARHVDEAGAVLAGHRETAFVAAITGKTSIFATVVCRAPADAYRYLTARVGHIRGVTHFETTAVVRHVKDVVRRTGPLTTPLGR